MNARSIERRLMSRRQHNIHGRRAYLTVRIPLSAIPEPLPPFDPPGEPIEWAYDWFVEPMGDEFLITRFDVATRLQPPGPEAGAVLSWRSQNAWGLLRIESMISSDDPRDPHAPIPDGPEIRLDPISARPLAQAYMARRIWMERWGEGKVALPHPSNPDFADSEYLLRDPFGEPWAHPDAPRAMTLLDDAGTYAKTVYPELITLNGIPTLQLTYAVKWARRETRRRFCAGIRRALDCARKEGFPTQLA